MVDRDEDILVYESPGIGLENETSLHSSIKKWYSMQGDRIEVKIDGYVVDIVRDGLLIEIQTKNFTAIRKKFYKLLQKHRIHLIYPIPAEKYIIKVDPSSKEVISRRKSPKNGKLVDLFDELIRMPEIINEDNFSLEILMIREEDITCEDGKGSWRRKGASIVDRKLTDVVGRTSFTKRDDFSIFLPDNLIEPFTNKTLAGCGRYKISKSRKLTYCLKKMGLIKEVGKIRNELLFEVIK